MSIGCKHSLYLFLIQKNRKKEIAEIKVGPKIEPKVEPIKEVPKKIFTKGIEILMGF